MIFITLLSDLVVFLKTNYYLFALPLAAIGVVISYKNFRKKSPAPVSLPSIEIQNNPVISTSISPNITPVNNINVNVSTASQVSENSQKLIKPIEIPLEYRVDALKSKVKILFIDDDKNFNVVKILKDSGWKQTSSVIDIKTVDQNNVKAADILFVDINGVGNSLSCENGGLDLGLMIKQKYPLKKVVIYSANKNNNAFHDAWDICDFKLEKNALPYQFQQLVEKYAIDLYGQ